MEINLIPGTQLQMIADRLGNGGLSFAGQGGGWHAIPFL
jgi:hypothetical protein